jgi:hypothetical protein
MIRTYELKTEMNKSKKEKVLSVMEEYRKTASLIAKKQWELFYKEGAFNKNSYYIGIFSDYYREKEITEKT